MFLGGQGACFLLVSTWAHGETKAGGEGDGEPPPTATTLSGSRAQPHPSGPLLVLGLTFASTLLIVGVDGVAVPESDDEVVSAR